MVGHFLLGKPVDLANLAQFLRNRIQNIFFGNPLTSIRYPIIIIRYRITIDMLRKVENMDSPTKPRRKPTYTTVSVEKEVAKLFQQAQDECKQKTGISPNNSEMLALAIQAWRSISLAT